MSGDDPFASGTISQILAWITVVPMVVAGMGGLVAGIFEKDELPRPYKLWLAFCLIFLAPGRYAFLVLLIASTYLVQSWHALFSGIVLVLYAPIVFGLLLAVGVWLPMLVSGLIIGNEEVQSTRRWVAGSIALPFACVAANGLFMFLLPFAAKTVHWLDADDVIGATNGPTALLFDYVVAPSSLLAVPAYFELTPMDPTARRRCHFAHIYLSEGQHAAFVDRAYPPATSGMMDEVRRTVERHFASTGAGNWAEVLDGSWYAPEYELALRDPATREQMLSEMEVGSATVQKGFKSMTVEVRLPTSAREIQGGKIVIVEVEFVFTPKPGVVGIRPTTSTTACVSTDYGKTWKVATSLEDVLRVYPNR